MHSASLTRDHLFVPSRSPVEAMCTTSGLNNYTKHLDEHGPISFCFYYTPEFHRKHETTRQKSQSLWTILRHDVFLIIPIDTIRTYIDQPNRSSLSLVIMHWRIGEDILVPFSI